VKKEVIGHSAEVPAENSVAASVSKGKKDKDDQGMEI
jgi:hypothetical protein